MVNNITMTHASVNSGTAVILEGAKVNYAWKNITSVDPITGKYDIVEAEYSGFENPRVVIAGHMDVDDMLSSGITQELLTEFATLRSTTAISLSVPSGATPTYLKGRPTAGYETDGDMTMLNTISVRIESFSIGLDGFNSDKGRSWTYQITCHETL